MRILIAHDNTILRFGLGAVLAKANLDVVGEVRTRDEVLGQAGVLKPDVILVGGGVAEADGCAVLPAIKALVPDTPIIVLTGEPDSVGLLRALANGALGYVSELAPVSELVAAVQTVSEGRTVIDGSVVPPAVPVMTEADEGGQPLEFRRAAPSLSPRERQVLALLAKGMRNAEIARTLSVSTGTVNNHVKNILRKLGVGDRVHAAVWAIKHGIEMD